MEKQEIVFDIPEGKKNSVCFKTSRRDVAVQSIYVMRSHLGSKTPKRIKVTIEEVE